MIAGLSLQLVCSLVCPVFQTWPQALGLGWLRSALVAAARPAPDCWPPTSAEGWGELVLLVWCPLSGLQERSSGTIVLFLQLSSCRSLGLLIRSRAHSPSECTSSTRNPKCQQCQQSPQLQVVAVWNFWHYAHGSSTSPS